MSAPFDPAGESPAEGEPLFELTEDGLAFLASHPLLAVPFAETAGRRSEEPRP